LQLSNNDPVNKYERKFIKNIIAETPGHAGELPQTDILLESEEAWVWGEALAVAVDSCKPGYVLRRWVPTQNFRILV